MLSPGLQHTLLHRYRSAGEMPSPISELLKTPAGGGRPVPCNPFTGNSHVLWEISEVMVFPLALPEEDKPTYPADLPP